MNRPETQQEWAQRWARHAMSKIFEACEWFEDSDAGWKILEALRALPDGDKKLIEDDLAEAFQNAHQERVRCILG